MESQSPVVREETVATEKTIEEGGNDSRLPTSSKREDVNTPAQKSTISNQSDPQTKTNAQEVQQEKTKTTNDNMFNEESVEKTRPENDDDDNPELSRLVKKRWCNDTIWN